MSRRSSPSRHKRRKESARQGRSGDGRTHRLRQQPGPAEVREAPQLGGDLRAGVTPEQGTRIADAAGGVTDEARANAAKYYDTEQLAALVCTIASINAYNRFNVILKNQGGDYQPGQWG